MTTYREMLDPNRTLPHVQLRTAQVYDFGYLLRDQLDIVAEREVVGHLDLVSEINNDERFAHFDGIEIKKAKRGRGIGMAAYLLAIEMSHARDFDFQTQNYELTEHSKRIWEHMAQKGVAQVVEPFTPSPRIEGRFLGKYRVPVQR